MWVKMQRFMLGVCSFEFGQDTLFNVDDYLDPLHKLGTPYNANYHPDNTLRARIAQYLHELTGLRRDQIKTKLPEVMPVWGRVHIAMGDSIRSAMASSKYRDQRDASHIRVCKIIF